MEAHTAENTGSLKQKKLKNENFKILWRVWDKKVSRFPHSNYDYNSFPIKIAEQPLTFQL
jgi:hypothetical protein